MPDPSDSSVFSPSHQAADESSEEASFYEILPCCARFRCGELIAEGQWHHLVLVMSKGMLKNSMATLYLDGQLVSTVKVSRSTAHTAESWLQFVLYFFSGLSENNFLT